MMARAPTLASQRLSLQEGFERWPPTIRRAMPASGSRGLLP